MNLFGKKEPVKKQIVRRIPYVLDDRMK